MSENKIILEDANEITLFAQLKSFDLLGAFGSKIGQRYIIDVNTKKLRFFKELFSQITEVPWIYVRGMAEAQCIFYQDCAEHLNFVPTYCLNCWKTVVAPSTLVDLLRLFALQKELAEGDPTCTCKCGYEERPYVPRLYGGYFYSRTQEDGLKRTKQVRAAVDQAIGPHVPVILKRYCTEFERKFGPTDQYKQGPDAKIWEEIINEYVDLPPRDYADGFLPQSELTRKHVLNKWLDFAIKYDYNSILAINNGKPIFRPLVTYHEEVRKGEEDGQ